MHGSLTCLVFFELFGRDLWQEHLQLLLLQVFKEVDRSDVVINLPQLDWLALLGWLLADSIYRS